MNAEITSITPITVAAGIVAHDASKRVLGPTADLIGQDLAKAYEFGKRNVLRVINVADNKLGTLADKNGGVHPRIARRVFNEARDIENAFAAEYFGGILASSHGPGSDDDSAVPFLKMLENLSARQMQLHFITHYLYCQSLARLPEDRVDNYWKKYGAEIEIEILKELYEEDDFSWRLTEDLRNLVALEVIGPDFSLRDGDQVWGRNHQMLQQPGLYVTFSPLGLRLFLRALGLRGQNPEVLPFMEIDESVSLELHPRLLKNAHARLFKNPFIEATSMLASEIEDVRSEGDDKVEGLKSEVEDLQSTIEQLRETIDELQKSSPDDNGSASEDDV